MQTYYGYGRVSTEDQGRKYSLGTQREYLEHRANLLGLPFEYLSDKQSGKTFDRPGWSLLVQKLQPGDTLGAQFNDRFGRNADESKKIAKEIFAKGISIEVNGYRFDFNNPTDDLIYSTLANIAEFQRKLQHQKSIEGIKSKKEKGEWVFKGNVHGYLVTKVGDKTKVEINQKEAEIIKYIFDEYTKGKSTRQIAIYLEEQGLRFGKQTKVDPMTVRRILLRPIYMGFYPVNGPKTKGVDTLSLTRDDLVQSTYYIPIIDPETWWKSYSSFRFVHRKHAQQFGYRFHGYLISGLLRCSYCGTGYAHSISKKYNNRIMEYYTNHVHKKGCPQKFHNFNMNFINNIFDLSYLIYLSSPAEQTEYLKKLEEEKSSLTKAISLQIQDSERRLDEINSGLDKIAEEVLSFVSSPTIKQKLIEKSIDLDKEKSKLENKIKTHKSEKNKMLLSLDADMEFILQEAKEDSILRYFHLPVEGKRKTLIQVLDKAFVDNEGIHIYFKNTKKIDIPLKERRGRRVNKDYNLRISYKGQNQVSLDYDADANLLVLVSGRETKFEKSLQASYYKTIEDLWVMVRAHIDDKP
jgi:DNA invertase Pin-like site-specific DNA recombinase